MKNYFTIFSLPQKFDIDLDGLEKKYLTFQQNFHPDKAGIDQIEQSILVNEAYEILNDPIKRATHILQIHGLDISDDSKAPRPDMATLQEILELQESLDQIDEKKKQEIKNKVADLIKETVKKIDEENFQEAAQILIKTKYYGKILKDLRK